MSSPSLQINKLISALGTAQFPALLMEEGAALLGFDHCILIHYPENALEPNTLFSAGHISETMAQDCADLYDNGLYRFDPNMACIAGADGSVESLVVQRRAEDYSNENYVSELLTRCHIKEKVSLLGVGSSTKYCLSFYQLSHSAPLSPAAIERFKFFSGVLNTIVQKHIELMGLSGGPFNLPWALERLVRSNGKVLTQRELEVCARIVVGQTSESMAKALNVTVNTILSHRKNAYEKLGINSLHQLFAIVVEANRLH